MMITTMTVCDVWLFDGAREFAKSSSLRRKPGTAFEPRSPPVGSPDAVWKIVFTARRTLTMSSGFATPARKPQMIPTMRRNE